MFHSRIHFSRHKDYIMFNQNYVCLNDILMEDVTFKIECFIGYKWVVNLLTDDDILPSREYI